MNPLLVVIPNCSDDSPYAERLLDFVYQLNGKQQVGHVLLAYAHDVHAEMKLKLKISAELAFVSVSEFQAAGRMDVLLPKTKTEFTNNLWIQTAHHIAGHFRWPWLYCEPDCVPITPDWIQTLADGYANQPMKYLGTRMKRITGETENFFMARTGIYPTIAYSELKGFIGTPPFEWTAGPHVAPRSSNTKLIQQINYDGDYAKVKPEAVLLHADKQGKLIEQLREKGVKANGHGENVEVQHSEEIKVGGHNGIWKSGLGETVRLAGVESPSIDLQPPDKRTKEYKDWAKRQSDNAKYLEALALGKVKA